MIKEGRRVIEVEGDYINLIKLCVEEASSIIGFYWRRRDDWISLLVGINCNFHFWNEILVEFLMHHLPVFLLLSHESLVILSQCLVEHEKKPRRKWKDKFSHVICHHFHVGVRRERSGTSLKFQKDASKAKIISHFLLHFIHMKETERYLRYRAFHIILVASLSLFIDMEMNVMTMLWETVIKFVGFLSTFT